MNTTYLRLETLRLLRNRQNFIFSLIFPVVLFYFVAGENRHEKIGSLSFPTYYMAGMIAFGGMGAVVGGGARIAFERQVGWTRQLRITTLSPARYFLAKVFGAYLMAAITIGLLYVAGTTLGVHMTLGRWLEMTGLVLVGLIPFAAVGIMLGHLVRSDSMGPIMGGGLSLLSIAGGAFGPLAKSGSIVDKLSQLVPTYWIVRAGHTALGGSAWGVKGWAIVLAWSVVLIYGATWAYRRDTGRQ